MDEGAPARLVFKVTYTRDLKPQQPQNSSPQGGEECSANPIPPHLVPLPEGFSPSRVSLFLIHIVLERGCLNLNPESSIYLLCDSGNLVNLSVLQFLHLESGGDAGPAPLDCCENQGL